MINSRKLKREWNLHKLGVADDSISESVFIKLKKYLSNPKPYMIFHDYDENDMDDEDRHIEYKCTRFGRFVMEYSPLNDFLYVDYKYVKEKIFNNSGYNDESIKSVILWWTKEILSMKYDLLFVRPQDSVLGNTRAGKKGKNPIWWCEKMF